MGQIRRMDLIKLYNVHTDCHSSYFAAGKMRKIETGENRLVKLMCGCRAYK